MKLSLQEIRPQFLSNQELVRYTWLLDPATVPESARLLITELAKRLEKLNEHVPQTYQQCTHTESFKW